MSVNSPLHGGEGICDEYECVLMNWLIGPYITIKLVVNFEFSVSIALKSLS